jgi:hypothetical protein
MRRLPQLELADSGAILAFDGPEGQPLMQFFEDCALTIELEDGEVKLSTVIRNPRGEIIAELIRNEWRVNPDKSFDRNYARGALEVRDETGDVVLQARRLKDRVQFAGKFHGADGRAVAIGKTIGPDGKVGGAIEITGPAHPRITMKIAPLFRYPSDLHFGEFVLKRRARARPKVKRTKTARR